MSSRSPRARIGTSGAFWTSLCLLVLPLATACGPKAESSKVAKGDAAPPKPTAAVYSCARCHELPLPEILPKNAWPPIIERMTALTQQYDLGMPLQAAEAAGATEWYVEHAPVGLLLLPPTKADGALRFRSEIAGWALDETPGGQPPIITHVEVVDLDADGAPEILVSDASRNVISRIRPNEGSAEGWAEEALVEVVAPARFDQADFDGDGDLDLVIASLGGLMPTEEPIGSVLLARQNGDGFEVETILTGAARVADVRPADMDGDGDLDVVVAQFGLFVTGGVFWVEQTEDGSWEPHRIVGINGVTHVPVVDLDGDGALDIVAVISQEHEEIEVFLNRDGGERFKRKRIYQAPHPMWGMSNIELVDFDSDGDPDILFSNGDALDQVPTPKPWHGVQWLENRSEEGELAFEEREIGRFHGAYTVRSGDLDGDGDLDVVSTSMMNQWRDPKRSSVVWFENDGSHGFSTHQLATAPIHLVAADVADLDGDGQADVVTGSMNVLQPFNRLGRVTVFRQTDPSAPAPAPAPQP